ncbi:MAG: 16S rRNA (uracil(1498)-N(3))-methyltransferase [Dysgonamonadaceae bacterium]|jgi:16S rRNA (uracil1498-N3)-methyltransferase|nr:16S rRNA (uracil(1498)-N(3))-methyltransferase [Dysgonamonadaceae bacterium]
MSDTLFFCPDILNNPQLSEQESQHCVKVLRMKEGDKIDVTDGKGFFYRCAILQAQAKRCVLSIEKSEGQVKPWNFHLQIAFAPTKNMDRNEWFVEKATEIGTDRFSPLLCRYSERKELKTERLEKISVSALKQSQQAFLPAIDEMTPFESFVASPFDGRKFIAHCHPSPKKTLAETYRKGVNALVLIGPEGDFSEQEVQQAVEMGFEAVSLGETRLRTETACWVACHTIQIINSLR